MTTMTRARVQCWEFKRCSREKDKTCPAVTQSAGRACWLVAGTLCGGQVQGTHAEKIGSCKECDFYITLKKGAI